MVKSKRHAVAVGDLDATETPGPMSSSERCRDHARRWVPDDARRVGATAVSGAFLAPQGDTRSGIPLPGDRTCLIAARGYDQARLHLGPDL